MRRLMVVTLGLLVFAAAAASPALADTKFVYSGTLDGSTTADGTGDMTSVHVMWSEIGSSPTLNVSAVTWSLATLSGMVTFSGDKSTGTPACSGTLSASPNPNKVYAPRIAPVMGGYEVLTYSPAQAGSSGSPMDSQVQSTEAHDTNCGTPYSLVASIEGCARDKVGASLDAALRPDAVFPAGSSAKQFDVPPIKAARCSTQQFSFSLSSSIQFTDHGPGGGPIPPGTPPAGTGQTLKELKDAAQADFRKAFKDAQGPCAQLAMGLGVEATGAVWLGTSATVPGGLPAGGAIIATGEVMTAAASSLCGPKIKRLLNDYRKFNDPPDSHYRQLAAVGGSPRAAKLRACGNLTGNVRAFCLELKTRVELLIGAVDHTAAVDDAIVTTINRASGARRAHDKRAVARQLSHAAALNGELRSALAAESVAGRGIQHLLPFGDLKRSQSARTIAYLERRGLTKRELAQIEPRGAGAAATDPISHLVDP
jgi:hypothetical protein